jgi:DNA topoisomerase-1
MASNSFKSARIDKHQEESEAFAEENGLRYVHDYEPGFTRHRRGKKFHYLDSAGKPLAKNLVARIEALVIPPAWENVWICRFANGHLQVTGRDARGRKQYRYHATWTATRNETKFENLSRLTKLLPQLRARVEKDLRRQGLPREKVIAAVVKLLELTQIRVGNEEYAVANDSYGLTTILNRHAQVKGAKIMFRFKGKSGVQHDVSIRDERLSKIVRGCQHLPGQDLFEYLGDDGAVHNVGSSDVNAYLKAATGGELTAKELRTWSGSVKALELLKKLGPMNEKSERARKARELSVIRETAKHLRNTVSVCRKYYVHPVVFEADRKGSLHAGIAKGTSTNRRKAHEQRGWLTSEERALAAILS